MRGLVPFDKAGFEAGITLAMGIGLPDDEEQRATFVFTALAVTTGQVDDEGYPLDPAEVPVVTPGKRVLVPCAVEYLDDRGDVLDFGIAQSSQARITLLDAAYKQVKGFVHVMLGGNKFFYRETAPPLGLADSTIWQVMVTTEDKA